MAGIRVLLVTGLPASGKTTLARALAARFGVPLIRKDAIKEPLLDVLGASDAAQSRRLSDASFAVLFALARELVAARTSFVLEGNFRPGEHESALRTVLDRGAPSVSAAQVLCRVSEPLRLARLAARADDPARHPGHRDAELRVSGDRRADAFLDLPTERFLYDASGEDAGADERLSRLLDEWWCGP